MGQEHCPHLEAESCLGFRGSSNNKPDQSLLTLHQVWLGPCPLPGSFHLIPALRLSETEAAVPIFGS